MAREPHQIGAETAELFWRMNATFAGMDDRTAWRRLRVGARAQRRVFGISTQWPAKSCGLDLCRAASTFSAAHDAATQNRWTG